MAGDRTLDDIVGSKGGDPSERLNVAFREIAPTGQAVKGRPGTIRCGSPLELVDRLKLELDPNCVLQRAFRSGAALIRNPGLNSEAHDWSITGGTFTAADPTETGPLFLVYGDRWSIRSSVLRNWYGGLGMAFGGNDIALDGIDAQTISSEWGAGVFRCIGGSGGRFMNLIGVGGDDVFQFVPVTNPQAQYFDRSISNMQFERCRGRSASARLMVAAVAGPQKAHRNTCSIDNAGFIDISGQGGQRSVVVANENGTRHSRIDGVFFRRCDIDASTELGKQAQSIAIQSSPQSGGIGRVTFDHVRVEGSQVVGMTADGVDLLELNDCTLSGRRGAMQVASHGRVGKLVLNRVHLGVRSGAVAIALGGRNSQVDLVEIDAETEAAVGIGSRGQPMRRFGRLTVTPS